MGLPLLRDVSVLYVANGGVVALVCFREVFRVLEVIFDCRVHHHRQLGLGIVKSRNLKHTVNCRPDGPPDNTVRHLDLVNISCL